MQTLPEAGLRRSLHMFRAFLHEQTDPELFYRTQAQDTLTQVARHLDVAGRVVLDVGGGGGWFTEAFRGAGATCFLVEPEAGRRADGVGRDLVGRDLVGRDLVGRDLVGGEAVGGDTNPSAPPDDRRERHAAAVRPGRLAPRATVAADGNRMPFPDGVADLTFSSNVLEHVPDPDRFVGEMIRVTRPRGLIYLSYTAWLSPWGGHETAPWHYLGGRRAAARYERRHGRAPGNLYGTSLFARHVGPVLRLVRRRTDVEVVEAAPRYYPGWMSWVVKVPAVREVATWNLLLVLRRRTAR